MAKKKNTNEIVELLRQAGSAGLTLHELRPSPRDCIVTLQRIYRAAVSSGDTELAESAAKNLKDQYGVKVTP